MNESEMLATALDKIDAAMSAPKVPVVPAPRWTHREELTIVLGEDTWDVLGPDGWAKALVLRALEELPVREFDDILEEHGIVD